MTIPFHSQEHRYDRLELKNLRIQVTDFPFQFLPLSRS